MTKPKDRIIKRATLATSHGEAAVSLVAETNPRDIGPSEYYRVRVEWPDDVGPAEAREFFRMAYELLGDADVYESAMRPATFIAEPFRRRL